MTVAGHSESGTPPVAGAPPRVVAGAGVGSSIERTRSLPGSVPLWLVILSALLVVACNGEPNDGEPEPASAPAAVQIGAENVVTVKRDVIVVGPIVSGELRAGREATVRAELGGQMLQVTLEEGQPVRKGALLGRIDARSLGDARQSAQSAVRSAETQLESARREAERAAQLVKAGALAQRDLDSARTSVATAEAQLADAKARLASADTSLADAVIRAPISGVVARRAVNAGDVVSPGTELYTIIDPASLRLDAAVPSDDLRSLRVGAAGADPGTRLRRDARRTNRAHRAAGRRHHAAGPDLRRASERRRTPRRRAVRRRPRHCRIRRGPRRPAQRGQHQPGRAVGGARHRRQGGKDRRHARPDRQAHRARADRRRA